LLGLLRDAIVECWKQSHIKWGNVDVWNRFYFNKYPRATIQKSHNDLNTELRILIENLRSGGASKKAIAMQSDLK
ncbi:5154_t:CDS:2, partial [Dentiscutata heterogama]